MIRRLALGLLAPLLWVAVLGCWIVRHWEARDGA